jgi:16S rRNA A1518/A1519 N6-dimethyltransferase RsmA/KsgA/DIM1 with predicted DNA glycosylase/AP lyase activity
MKKIGGENLLKDAGIDPKKRPQEINIQEFCRLASLYEARESKSGQ